MKITQAKTMTAWELYEMLHDDFPEKIHLNFGGWFELEHIGVVSKNVLLSDQVVIGVAGQEDKILSRDDSLSVRFTD